MVSMVTEWDIKWYEPKKNKNNEEKSKPADGKNAVKSVRMLIS